MQPHLQCINKLQVQSCSCFHSLRSLLTETLQRPQNIDMDGLKQFQSSDNQSKSRALNKSCVGLYHVIKLCAV